MTPVPSPLAPLAQAGPVQNVEALARAAVKRPWTTPRRLHAMQRASWALALVLLLVGESTLSRARSALHTVAKDTAPSILAAAEIGASLAELDANVANALLGNASHRAAAEAAVEEERARVSQGILRAAENITYGDAERAPLNSMILDLGRYLERQAEARLLHATGDEGGAREKYWAATAILHDNLLLYADAVDHANKAEMDKAYGAQLRANEGSEFAAAAAGLALLGALAWTQWFIARRMRRMVNLPLLGASVATLALTFYLAGVFSGTRENLRVAKTDAFDSIYALVRARALAYDANGAESRFLLDPTRGFDRDWKRAVARLTETPDLPANARRLLELADPGSRNHTAPRLTGLFWDEIRNVTFPGEYDAAANLLRQFATYYAIDTKIRALKAQGKDADAVELCIGSRPDESNAAFDRFDKAVQATLDLNQAAFDQATGRAEASLKGAEIFDPGLVALIAVLVWLGLRPRLREYEA